MDTNGTEGAKVFERLMSVPLSDPVTAGKVDTTLILYAVPAGTDDGITPNIYVLLGISSPPKTIEPISVGVSKFPKASESWAIKVLAISKVAPLAVKSITMAEPSQIEVAEIGRVIISALPLTSSRAGALEPAISFDAETVLAEQTINKAENKAK